MVHLRVLTMNMATGSGFCFVDFSGKSHAAFIKQLAPDVVFLQEVDRGTRRVCRGDLLKAIQDSTDMSHGHFVKWKEFQGGQYGIAIASRHPLQNQGDRSIKWKSWVSGGVVAPVAYAQVVVEGETIDLWNTHVPTDPERDRRRSIRALGNMIPADKPMVLGGDFNSRWDYPELSAYEDKFQRAETSSARRNGKTEFDHIYTTRTIECLSWESVQADTPCCGRHFSDHWMVYTDVVFPAVEAPVYVAAERTTPP